MRHALVKFTAFSLLLCLGVFPVFADDSQPKSFSHRTPRDSVDWSQVDPAVAPPREQETDREWRGEALGLSGPIIATGGEGKKEYILVFDPAGILVGGILNREAEAHPERLEALIKKAFRRGDRILERTLEGKKAFSAAP